MATKYKIEFNKLKATWSRRGTVKGKKILKWSGKRGAFSAIAKAASKAAGKKSTKRKTTRKKATPKRRATKKRATKKRAAPKRAARKKPSRKAPKAKKPARAKRKNVSRTDKRRYVVGGKSRSITPYRAEELRKAGKKVRLAKTQKGSRRASRRGKAGVGLLGLVAGAAVVVGLGYVLTRKRA